MSYGWVKHSFRQKIIDALHALFMQGLNSLINTLYSNLSKSLYFMCRQYC